MGKGTGITLTVPSGATLDVSPAYRYVLVIDAQAGSWVEARAKTPAPIKSRARSLAGVALRQGYVFDTETGERSPARDWR